MNEFGAKQVVNPDELGDTLARLVWESFTDFLAELEETQALEAHGIDGVDDNPHLVEEILILLMWAHTRTTELAFAGRAPDALLRKALDEMHGAVFEDIGEYGTPRSQLPVFEQRVGARYIEYNAAGERSLAEVGAAAVDHLFEDREIPGDFDLVLSERIREVSDPLRDYLDDVELARDG